MIVQPWDIVKPANYNYQDFPDLTVSIGQNICSNYSITAENECTPQSEEAIPSFQTRLFIEIAEWNPPTKQDIIVAEENEAGDRRVRMHRQKRFISFRAVVDDFYLNTLYNIMMYQTWRLRREDNGSEFELSSFEVSTPNAVGKGYYTVDVTMGIEGGDVVISSCCGSAYENAPYEDCTDPDSGNPNPPAECADYALNPIVYDAVNGTLTVTSVNQPAGTTETFKWYYFRTTNSPVQVLTTTAAVINVSEPGTYRAVGVAGVCQTAPQDFLLQDDCDSYSATIEQDGDYIIVTPNRISTVVWEVDTGAGFGPYLDTDLIIKPDQSGTYRATLTSGTCELVLTIAFTITDCDFIVSITETDDILTAVVSGYAGAGSPSYQWYLDNGSGETLITGAVSDTIVVTEPGNYIVEVTLDDCTKRANKVLLSACYGFDPFIDYVKPDGLGNVLIMSGHTGAPGPVDIVWWQVRNGEWTVIGSGSQILTDQEGPTKMVATSEDCVKERFTQACIDPSASEWQERFVATQGQTSFTPVQIILPTITTQTEDEIGAEYELYRNGARLDYRHLVNLAHRSEWSIDGSTFVTNWPSVAGDVYILVKRYIP